MAEGFSPAEDGPAPAVRAPSDQFLADGSPGDPSRGGPEAEARPHLGLYAVEVPPAGRRQVYPVYPQLFIKLSFDLGLPAAGRRGDDMVLCFDNGGEVVLRSFVRIAGTHPTLHLLPPDGSLLPGDYVADALTELGEAPALPSDDGLSARPAAPAPLPAAPVEAGAFQEAPPELPGGAPPGSSPLGGPPEADFPVADFPVQEILRDLEAQGVVPAAAPAALGGPAVDLVNQVASALPDFTAAPPPEPELPEPELPEPQSPEPQSPEGEAPEAAVWNAAPTPEAWPAAPEASAGAPETPGWDPVAEAEAANTGAAPDEAFGVEAAGGAPTPPPPSLAGPETIGPEAEALWDASPPEDPALQDLPPQDLIYVEAAVPPPETAPDPWPAAEPEPAAEAPPAAWPEESTPWPAAVAPLPAPPEPSLEAQTETRAETWAETWTGVAAAGTADPAAAVSEVSRPEAWRPEVLSPGVSEDARPADPEPSVPAIESEFPVPTVQEGGTPDSEADPLAVEMPSPAPPSAGRADAAPDFEVPDFELPGLELPAFELQEIAAPDFAALAVQAGLELPARNAPAPMEIFEAAAPPRPEADPGARPGGPLPAADAGSEVLRDIEAPPAATVPVSVAAAEEPPFEDVAGEGAPEAGTPGPGSRILRNAMASVLRARDRILPSQDGGAGAAGAAASVAPPPVETASAARSVLDEEEVLELTQPAEVPLPPPPLDLSGTPLPEALGPGSAGAPPPPLEEGEAAAEGLDAIELFSDPLSYGAGVAAPPLPEPAAPAAEAGAGRRLGPQDRVPAAVQDAVRLALHQMEETDLFDFGAGDEGGDEGGDAPRSLPGAPERGELSQT